MSDESGQPEPIREPGGNPEPKDGLLSRLRVIEDQPLESRAEALGHLHDELRSRLEAGDAPRR